MSLGYEIVIGLEVHVELATKTKIFCGCSTEFGGVPNSHTCPVCLGMPGSLPVLNKAVVEKAIAAGIATHCDIPEANLFDRKNYFYPDLPKAYQISQLYHPICQNGWVPIETSAGVKHIRIHEIHMEEDAGKLAHEAGVSLVDYNRCGVPLIEIVTEPDMRSADEVEAFLAALRETLVYLGVSDCKMEEGSMRADVNLSLREAGSEEYGTRTETKNMNSVKAIRRAIDYEAERQAALLQKGERVIQETRRWDDNTGENFAMRNKENAQDYRYFPDPDLVPLLIDAQWVSAVTSVFPELADAKRARYRDEWGLPEKAARVLTAEKNIAELFEAIVAALTAGSGGTNDANPDGKGVPGAGREDSKNADMRHKALETSFSEREAASEAANIVMGEILRLVKETGADADKVQIDAGKIAEVLQLVKQRKINRAAGREVAGAIFRSDISPAAYIQKKNLETAGDENSVKETVLKVLADNPKSVADFKAGKEKAYGFLVGQTMRAFAGKADPAVVNVVLKAELEKAGVPVTDEIAGIKPLPAVIPGSISPVIPGLPRNPLTSSVMDCGAVPVVTDADGAEYKPLVQEIPAWKKSLDDRGLPPADPSSEKVDIKTSVRYRDMTCGDLREEHVGQTVRLAGWVMTIRNHGGIVFADLRDMYGVTQVILTEEMVDRIGKEYSISVLGKVTKRGEETFNPAIATGTVELRTESLEILGPCKGQLPFEVMNSTDTREDLRLKYRYLDLRNPKLKNNLLLRAEVIKHLRREMEALGFLEVQTPILANSSPEGARDYLVPSRKHKGKFYALPQAPQQFKQLLMASGFDRYYQIAPCFRDEDARLDRSPGEFYQLDFEMAYATQEDVFAVAERVLGATFDRFSDKAVTRAPYPRIPYPESMLRYGNDKPDLRNPLFIIDLTDFFAEVDFAAFKGRPVRAIRVPGATAQPRSFFRDMEKYALGIGMKGLGYVTVQDDGTFKGPIDKFLTGRQKTDLTARAELAADDALYFISDDADKVNGFAGLIRTEVAVRLGLIDQNRFALCFITDYPMYEYNEEAGKIDFTHNPFSMPQGEMEALLTKDPLDVLAYQYDIVCNGVELSSGAVRNHRPDVMVKAFEIAGYSESDVEQKFGALYSAFGYGAPPHAGMAPGVDRIVMLLAGEENIREIIAFPLNSNAQNLMLDAPSEVSEQQLRDVHIKIR
ncbi:hypothetical protein AGMMS49983_18930 [Clostridia bacterium]|nr:hypothetical protein AGMMS49983_18930 [Clostridia bacterium]